MDDLGAGDALARQNSGFHLQPHRIRRGVRNQFDQFMPTDCTENLALAPVCPGDAHHLPDFVCGVEIEALADGMAENTVVGRNITECRQFPTQFDRPARRCALPQQQRLAFPARVARACSVSATALVAVLVQEYGAAACS